MARFGVRIKKVRTSYIDAYKPLLYKLQIQMSLIVRRIDISAVTP